MTRADLTGPPAEPVAVAADPRARRHRHGRRAAVRGKDSAGGGADFAPYDPGDIGDGLDPLGPLGPTALGYGAEFPKLDDAFGDRRRRRRPRPARAPPEPPPPDRPHRLRPVDRADDHRRRHLRRPGRCQPRLPVRLDRGRPGAGREAAAGGRRINGIDPANVTLDAERDGERGLRQRGRAVPELAGRVPDRPRRVLGNAGLVFANVSSTEARSPDGLGPLVPGTAVDLGDVAGRHPARLLPGRRRLPAQRPGPVPGRPASSCAMAATSRRWRAWTTGRRRCWSTSRATS